MSDQHCPQLDKITVRRILHLDNPPRILATSDLFAVDFDHGVGTNDGKGDGLAKLLNLLLVVLILVTKIGRFGLIWTNL